MKNNSTFLNLVGNSPKARIVDFLIENTMFDYSLSDIAKEAEVGWTTLHTFWSKWEKSGLVVQTRNVGKAKMYKLNVENPTIQALIKFDFELSKQAANKVINAQRVKAQIS